MPRKFDSPDRPLSELLKIAWRLLKDSFSAAPLDFVLVSLGVLSTSLVPFLQIYLSTKVIDSLVSLIGKGTPVEFPEELVLLVVFSVGSDLLQSIFWMFRSYFDRRQYFRLGMFFLFRFMEQAANLEVAHYENSKLNDVIQRAKESHRWRPQAVASRLPRTVGYLIVIIASMGVVLGYSPLFFLIIFATTLPGLIADLKSTNVAWFIWDADTETRRKFDDIHGVLGDENSLMELRIFRTKDYLYNQAQKIFSNFYEKEQKASTKKTLTDSLFNMVSFAGTASFWVFLITNVLSGNLTIGLLTFYSSISQRFSANLRNLFVDMSRHYEDMKYMVDYYTFMDLKKKIKSGKTRLAKSNKPPRIEFKHVDFTYPEAKDPVLRDFELTIEPGEKIAFVGVNGAGKSTVIKLLSRFYDVTSGQILINGVNIKDIDIDDWYKNLGVLFQNFMKFGFLNAKKNISLGDVERVNDFEEIQKAAKKAGAHDLITKLKKGYGNVLSKRYPKGTDLSGGEWQRMALARGFFKDSSILILDEPTSQIDAKGESEIFERLYEFSEGKTVIIVSHRFSTVRLADKIYVIDGGQIVESGSHKELIDMDGKYADSFRRQAEGYRE